MTALGLAAMAAVGSVGALAVNNIWDIDTSIGRETTKLSSRLRSAGSTDEAPANRKGGKLKTPSQSYTPMLL